MVSSNHNQPLLQFSLTQGAKLFAPRWMIVFDYGALVFFNFDQSELAAELQVVSQFCETALEERMTDGAHRFLATSAASLLIFES